MIAAIVKVCMCVVHVRSYGVCECVCVHAAHLCMWCVYARVFIIGVHSISLYIRIQALYCINVRTDLIPLCKVGTINRTMVLVNCGVHSISMYICTYMRTLSHPC